MSLVDRARREKKRRILLSSARRFPKVQKLDFNKQGFSDIPVGGWSDFFWSYRRQHLTKGQA